MEGLGTMILVQESGKTKHHPPACNGKFKADKGLLLFCQNSEGMLQLTKELRLYLYGMQEEL